MLVFRLLVVLITGGVSGLKYLGGIVNWQTPIEFKTYDGPLLNPDNVIVFVNINWKLEANELGYCDMTQTKPRIDITAMVNYTDAGLISDFQSLRCSIVEMGEWNILKVTDHKTYGLPNWNRIYKIRLSGNVDTNTNETWLLSTEVNRTITKTLFTFYDSPPVVAAPPLVSICTGALNEFYIQGFDVDVSLHSRRCRWSIGKEECGTVCTSKTDQNRFNLTEACDLSFETTITPAQPEMIILTITVEGYLTKDSTKSPISSANFQFTAEHWPDGCNNDLTFSDILNQKELFQDRAGFTPHDCATSDMEIKFTATTKVSNSLDKVIIASGPADFQLSLLNKDIISSPAVAVYSLRWSPSPDDIGTHPICVAATALNQTKYACSTITSYNDGDAMPMLMCGTRSKCKSNEFCYTPPPTTQPSTTTTKIVTTATSEQPTTPTTQLSTTTTEIVTTATTEHPTTTTTTNLPSTTSTDQPSTINTQLPTTTLSTLPGVPPAGKQEIEAWMIGSPLALLALLALVGLLVLLYKEKKKKKRGQVQEMEEDMEPDEDYIHNHKPAVQPRRFSNLSEVMPNAIPIPKPGYTPNKYGLSFSQQLKQQIKEAQEQY